MRTLLITDGKEGVLQKVEAACKAGVDAIQLREKTLSDRELFSLALKVRAITLEWGVSFFVNERLDVAWAAGADGVHFPEESPLLQATLIRGKSVHSLEAALRAEQEGADYVLVGLKKAPLGKEVLKQVARALTIPVMAVGGITPSNTGEHVQLGAQGVGAISAFEKGDLAETIQSFHAHFSRRKNHIRGVCAILSTLEMAEHAVQGGVDSIQFRHKGRFTEEVFEEARRMRMLCKRAGIPFLINDRVDIALALDADGMHIGQEDLPIQALRRIFSKIIGKTAGSVEEALEVEKSGADYVGFGHIFETTTKKKESPPLGVEAIGVAKRHLKIPLIAIGGITVERASDIKRAGADGIAVVGAITRARDPLEAVRQLKRVF